jgi:hypothetical protein
LTATASDPSNRLDTCKDVRVVSPTTRPPNSFTSLDSGQTTLNTSLHWVPERRWRLGVSNGFRDPQPLGTPRACPGMYRNCFNGLNKVGIIIPDDGSRISFRNTPILNCNNATDDVQYESLLLTHHHKFINHLDFSDHTALRQQTSSLATSQSQDPSRLFQECHTYVFPSPTFLSYDYTTTTPATLRC